MNFTKLTRRDAMKTVSGYLSVWFMGSYMVFVLTGAVLGDLLLLPALILLFDKERRRGSPRPAVESSGVDAPAASS